MTVKMRDMKRWKMLPDGQYLDLPGKRRVVTLEVNVSRVTRLDVEEKGFPRLLRVVEPWECPLRLQFAPEGDCTVIPTTDGEVWYFTDDGDAVNFAVTTKSFTKLEQRMEMTPELEVTILKANIRLEQRRREVAELKLIQQQRDEAAAANADPETGEIVEEQVVVDPGTGTPEPVAPAGDGTASE